MTVRPPRYAVQQGSNEVLHVLHPRLKYPHLWRGRVFAVAPCLGKGGTRIQDFSGLGNHSALTNMDAATDWVSNNGVSALDFDGTTNDYVTSDAASATSLAATLPGHMTAECWFYPRAGSGHVLLNNYAGNLVQTYGLNFGTNLANKISFQNNSNAHAITAATSSALNQWHHVAVTRAGLPGAWEMSIYLNGRLDATATSASDPGSTNSSTRIVMGGLNINFWMFDGLIATSSLYNRVLQAGEINLLSSRIGADYEEKEPQKYYFFSGGGTPVDCDPNDTQSSSQCSQSTVTAKFATDPNDAQSSSQCSQPTLTAKFATDPNDSQSSAQCSQPVLTVRFACTINSEQSSSQCSQPDVTANNEVNPNDSQSSAQCSQPVVSVKFGCTVNSAQSSPQCSQPVTTVKLSCAPNGFQSLSQCSQVSVTVGGAVTVSRNRKLFLQGGLFV